MPVACTLWAFDRGSPSALPARDLASLAAETLPLPQLAGAWVGVAAANGAPPNSRSPGLAAGSAPGFERSRAAPSPARISPPPRPLPAALGEPGPRGSSSYSRIWGAAPARGEAWGARGPGPGPGPRRADLRANPSGGVRAAQRPSGPEAAEALGAGEDAGVARGGPTPFPGPVRRVPRQDPQIRVS